MNSAKNYSDGYKERMQGRGRPDREERYEHCLVVSSQYLFPKLGSLPTHCSIAHSFIMFSLCS